MKRKRVLKKFSGQFDEEKFREGILNDEKTGYGMWFHEGCGVKWCGQGFVIGISSSYHALSVSLNLGNWPYRTSKSSCKPRKHVIGGV